MKKIAVIIFLILCNIGYSQKFSSLVDTLVPCNCTYKQKPVMLKLLERNHIRYDSIYALQTTHPSGIPDSALLTTLLHYKGNVVKVYFVKLKRSIVLIPQEDLPVKKRLYKEIVALMENEYGKNSIPKKLAFEYLKEGFPPSGGPDF